MSSVQHTDLYNRTIPKSYVATCIPLVAADHKPKPKPKPKPPKIINMPARTGMTFGENAGDDMNICNSTKRWNDLYMPQRQSFNL